MAEASISLLFTTARYLSILNTLKTCSKSFFSPLRPQQMTSRMRRAQEQHSPRWTQAVTTGSACMMSIICQAGQHYRANSWSCFYLFIHLFILSPGKVLFLTPAAKQQGSVLPQGQQSVMVGGMWAAKGGSTGTSLRPFTKTRGWQPIVRKREEVWVEKSSPAFDTGTFILLNVGNCSDSLCLGQSPSRKGSHSSFAHYDGIIKLHEELTRTSLLTSPNSPSARPSLFRADVI